MSATYSPFLWCAQRYTNWVSPKTESAREMCDRPSHLSTPLFPGQNFFGGSLKANCPWLESKRNQNIYAPPCNRRNNLSQNKEAAPLRESCQWDRIGRRVPGDGAGTHWDWLVLAMCSLPCATVVAEKGRGLDMLDFACENCLSGEPSYVLVHKAAIC